MNTFINVSELYGEMVDATIADYQALNPSGDFEIVDTTIVEHTASGDVIVAAK